MNAVADLRPGLREQPDRVVQAVAYMIPVINYGDIVSDHHCLVYGATVLGLREEEYYRQICDLADAVGAEPHLSRQAEVAMPVASGEAPVALCNRPPSAPSAHPA